jgi:rhodanese-related sulfurtransferase
VTRAELKRRLGGDTVILDVRPAPEYQAGHIAGAISMPIDELPTRLQDLPPDTDVVAYCRGPYCVYADQAVRMLSRHDIRAARLEDGYPEWARAQLPVETLSG